MRRLPTIEGEAVLNLMYLAMNPNLSEEDFLKIADKMLSHQKQILDTIIEESRSLQSEGQIGESIWRYRGYEITPSPDGGYRVSEVARGRHV